MRLLLVDGTNITMRAAFTKGAKNPMTPEETATTAVQSVFLAARELQATHCIVCFDHPDTNWRRQISQEYKAKSSGETRPYVQAAIPAMNAAGIITTQLGGFEADDLIATFVRRAQGREVYVLSQDSDLLVLASATTSVVQYNPKTAPSRYGVFGPILVSKKYRIPSPTHLTLYKALVGEPGDGVAGVPGIGPAKAARLVTKYGTREAMLEAARTDDKDAQLLIGHGHQLELAERLITLRDDAPVDPIPASHCALLQYL